MRALVLGLGLIVGLSACGVDVGGNCQRINGYLFGAMDKNGDGKIEEKEFRKAPSLSTEAIYRAQACSQRFASFAQVDASKNGTISEYEFDNYGLPVTPAPKPTK